MPTNTLTSLAMLKVNIDQGRDYLDYIRPFIFHVLMEHSLTLLQIKLSASIYASSLGYRFPRELFR